MTNCHSVARFSMPRPFARNDRIRTPKRHAEQAADAARQADTAEHHGGDHLELEAEAGDMNRRASRDDSRMPAIVAKSALITKQVNLMRFTS